MTNTTITTSFPLRRGSWIAIDGEGPLRVASTTGSGPYMSVVRRVPRWRIRLSHAWHQVWNWAGKPWRDWLATRCEPDEIGVRCWRRATQGDYCDRHAFTAVAWDEDA